MTQLSLNTKNKLKQFETTKAFYNKYLFRLTLVNSLTFIFRNKNFTFASTCLDKLQKDYENGHPLRWSFFRRDIVIKESHFIDAIILYNELSRFSGDYRIRCENNTLNIYSNELEFLNRLIEKTHNATDWYEPDENVQNFLQSNTNIIIVDQEPKLKYKIKFNHNTVNPQFADWLENNSDKAKASRLLIEDIRNSGYINNRYIYVRDENVIMLVKILIGSSIQRIDKLVSKRSLDK